MLTDYIQAALRHAHYEFIDGPKPYYGAIPNCPGVWATAESLEDWIVLGLRLGHPIPSLTTEPTENTETLKSLPSVHSRSVYGIVCTET